MDIRLSFSAQPDSRHVAGRLRDEQGAEHAFSSWLGLLSLLQAARARSSGSPAGPNPAR